MASRESQGLQVALILFVFITVALSISTYVYFRKAEEKMNEALAAQDQARQANNIRDRVLLENQRLKEFIGWAPEAQLADVERGYNDDMTLFAADYPADEPKNYRKLPDELLKAIRVRQQQVAQFSEEIRQRADEVKAIEDREIAKTRQFEQAQLAAQQELAGERTKFAGDRDRHKDDQARLATRVADLSREATAVAAKQAQELQAREQQISLLRSESDAKSEVISELRQDTFEIADGRVIWVDQRAGTLWVNLGLLDGLRTQTNFSVYEPGRNSYDVENSKGTIEITRILDKHLAEARIISDQSTDPILPSDLIFTPLWRPGKQVHFAIAGMIDVNGDGSADNQLVRNLIELNNGVVDAEVDETGKRTGRMSVGTRYLVLGAQPTERTSQEALRGYTNMLTEAQNLGVEQISVDKLLAYLGYQGTERSVQLGNDASAADFKAQPVDGVNRTSPSGPFRERRPPAVQPGGAY